jgi:pyruvate-formate lyase-activating enzyme
VGSRQTIERGWFYVIEPDGGTHAPVDRRLEAGDGRVLTRRAHGFTGHIQVHDTAGLGTPTMLRAAAAVGHSLESGGHPADAEVRVILGPAGTTPSRATDKHGQVSLTLDGQAVASAPSHHSVQASMAEHLGQVPPPEEGCRPAAVPQRTERVLFFESLMNTDMPHNDREISQGVLHMASPLAELGIEAVMVNVKMAITGQTRPVEGLDRLREVLQGPPIGLICITLLEGYFDGVCTLIQEIRAQGCRAHIAVGGVMPTLAPEHVMAHLPEVSFVCRGDGEVHLPQLAMIASGGVDTVYTQEELDTMSALSGLIAHVQGPSGPVLLSERSDQVLAVSDLDSVPLDLQHLQPRHIEGGIEISTSRGCIHKCTFCSIMGRESYNARSAEGIFDLLDRYQAHFEGLFGADIPQNAYRVHICDDDFACDPSRAQAFFEGLLDTPFRLSSIQVSVADLCRRVEGKLIPEVNTELLDSIHVDCFADAHAQVPYSDFVADHKTRRWSSFLAIGVETFSAKELVRLGKGYGVAHIRAVVDALSARGLHMDAYFIQSNSQTSAEDMIDGLDELCRLKMAHPATFHIRFPIVPKLVSYFTCSSYRRMLRQGQTHTQTLRGHAQVPGIPEYDYPFVEQDEPQDSLVALAVEAGFFTDTDLYTGSLSKLHELWSSHIQDLPDGPERRRTAQLIRRLDDRPRRLAFDVLAQARRAEQTGIWAAGLPSEADAIAAVEAVVGPPARWLRAYSRHDSNEIPRLTVIPTWQCELRCRYCFIPKQDGRVMTTKTLDGAIDMLLASDRERLMLQFFGGEALVEWPLVQHAIASSHQRASAQGQHLEFILSSNGWSIDEEKLAWLAEYPVKLELSLDGDSGVQNKFRRALAKGEDSYARGIPHKAEMIKASGLAYDVIMVVHPEAVDQMPESFFHIADLGFERIQINFGLGYIWTDVQKTSFASGLHRIGQELRRRWQDGSTLVMVNLEGRPLPIRLNAEITVDWDGVIYGGNSFLHETEHKPKFVIGHLDDLGSFDRYWMDAPSNSYLLDWSYPPDVTSNNLSVGAIMTSFIKWMQADGVGPEQHVPGWAQDLAVSAPPSR